MIRQIEINFAKSVELTDEHQQRLLTLVSEIAKYNEPWGRVHWVSGYGSKPIWNEPNEPTFNEEVYHIETYCREKYGKELKEPKPNE